MLKITIKITITMTSKLIMIMIGSFLIIFMIKQKLILYKENNITFKPLENSNYTDGDKIQNYKMNSKIKGRTICNKRKYSSWEGRRRFHFSMTNNKESSVALVNYLNKVFLKPILNIEDKLLTPIIYNENILNQIQNIQYMFSRFPSNNLVKFWLKLELYKKIIINGKVSKFKNELLREIIEIETINKKIETVQLRDENIFSSPSSFLSNPYNPIKSYPKTYKSKSIFRFNKMEKGLTKNLLNNKRYLHYACCYIITFYNKFYYYIGSTINIKNRFKTHTNNINNYCNNKSSNSLSELFKFFLLSCMEKGSPPNFDINIIYLSTNYLNKFINTYPNYKLNKGEW